LQQAFVLNAGPTHINSLKGTGFSSYIKAQKGAKLAAEKLFAPTGRLYRLRKKGGWRENFPKNIPQGLKPPLILLALWHG
jgi:hypothetical protein